MKRLLAALIFILVATPSWAGFEDGMQAFLDGRPDRALKHWLPLAQQDEARAQYWVGVAYGGNHLAPIDQKLAEKYLSMAAAQGHSGAMMALGHLFAFNKEDELKGIEWFKKAAQHGEESALTNLCNAIFPLLDDGIQRQNDLVQVIRSQAAQNDPIALYNLGWLNIHGECDVDKNPTEANRLYGMSASASLSKAQFSLSIAYQSGRDVPRDTRRAFDLLVRAAEQGHPNAQSRLGAFYQGGDPEMNISNNSVKALFWYKVIMLELLSGEIPDVGFENWAVYMATEGIKELSQGMSRKQIAEAESLASAWEPKN